MLCIYIYMCMYVNGAGLFTLAMAGFGGSK
jgi:hypothetical protein